MLQLLCRFFCMMHIIAAKYAFNKERDKNLCIDKREFQNSLLCNSKTTQSFDETEYGVSLFQRKKIKEQRSRVRYQKESSTNRNILVPPLPSIPKTLLNC